MQICVEVNACTNKKEKFKYLSVQQVGNIKIHYRLLSQNKRATTQISILTESIFNEITFYQISTNDAYTHVENVYSGEINLTLLQCDPIGSEWEEHFQK